MDKKSKVALGVLSLGAVITAVVLATRQTKATPTGSTTLSGAVTDTIMNTGIAGVLITLGNLSE
jgi:hypothetical protein